MLQLTFIVALCGVTAMQVSAQKEMLSPAQEAGIRRAVYDSPHLTETPRPGSPRVLVLPQELVKIHRERPRPVIELLVRIMEGADPSDSALAAGFAVSLLAGPEVGVICVESFDSRTYDSIDKNWEVSPRQHWIAKVEQRLAQQEGRDR